MDKQYKVVRTFFEAPPNHHNAPTTEEFPRPYDTREGAMIALLSAVIEDTTELNTPSEEAAGQMWNKEFLADLIGDHVAIIRLWDGSDYWDVAYYDIIRVDTELPTYTPAEEEGGAV